LYGKSDLKNVFFLKTVLFVRKREDREVSPFFLEAKKEELDNHNGSPRS
jgi:hypothetical protein